jgi:hypothetical protein
MKTDFMREIVECSINQQLSKMYNSKIIIGSTGTKIF